MSQRFLLCIMITLALSAFGGWQAQEGLTPPPRPAKANPAAPGTNGVPFAPGERLIYNVTWANFAAAARLEMEIAGQGAFFGEEGYQLRTRVETTGDVRSLFIELDHLYLTYVNPSSMLPYRIENSRHEGGRRSDETIMIEQKSGIARGAADAAIALTGETYDLTSLIYALRRGGMDGAPKRKYQVLLDGEAVEVDAEVKGRERVTTQVGVFEATRIDLATKTKKQGRLRLRIYLATDATRRPVAIAAQMPFGEVRAELSNVIFEPRTTLALTREKAGGRVRGEGELAGEGESRLPFAVGERLNYDVSWGSFATVGKASFAVRQRGRIGDKRVLELVGEATTTGAARALIDVNDQFISYAEALTLVPVRTETHLQEGRRLKRTTAEYNWSQRYVRLTNGTQIGVEPGTRDLLSLFYAVRAADLKPGATYQYALLDANHRPINLSVKVNRQETIGGALGSQQAWQLDITSRELNQLAAQVWISSDARRLPLYLAVRTRFGELRFQLSSAVGTR